MTDGSGVTNYSYDIRNRLSAKQTPFGTLTYTYDENSNLKSTNSSNPNGVSLDYAYDPLNRVSGVRDNRLSGNQETTYSYDAVGNLQSYSYPNQVTTSYAYNNLNRLTTLTVSNGQVNLASYAYTLGASGNRTQVIEGNGRTVNYGYDDLYRLTSETINNAPNSGQITYQYDAVGNRLSRNSSVNQVPSMSSTFDNNDRLTSDGYDNNGSTKVSNGKSYNYDFENKLTSTSDGVQIGYDGDGNRISKTVNGQTTFYLVDTNNLTGYAQVVEELQNGVGVVKSYTYGLDLISQRSSSGVNFYQYDGHGSVRGLTDTNAQLTDTYAYDAFGTLIEKTGNTANNYLYAGEQFDADLGFYYNRARYLNTATGRFISQDTFEGNSSDPLSLHKYLYGGNNPIGNIDPSGNYSISEVVQTVQIYARSAFTTLKNAYSTYSKVTQFREKMRDLGAGIAILAGVISAIATRRTDANAGYSIDFNFPLFDYSGEKYPDIKLGYERRLAGPDRGWLNVIRGEVKYPKSDVSSRVRYSFDDSLSGGALSGGFNYNLVKKESNFGSFEIDFAARVGTSFGQPRDVIGLGIEFKHKWGFGSLTSRYRIVTIALTGGTINDNVVIGFDRETVGNEIGLE
jgi:RHS repeat-associated protein